MGRGRTIWGRTAHQEMGTAALPVASQGGDGRLPAHRSPRCRDAGARLPGRVHRGEGLRDPFSLSVVNAVPGPEDKMSPLSPLLLVTSSPGRAALLPPPKHFGGPRGHREGAASSPQGRLPRFRIKGLLQRSLLVSAFCQNCLSIVPRPDQSQQLLHAAPSRSNPAAGGGKTSPQQSRALQKP